MYMAEVIDNEDPETPSSGRVKVRVFPMMTGLEESVLPWAVPAFGLFEGGAPDMGAYTVPSTGSRVWVFLAAGDVRVPVYFAAAPAMTDGPDGATSEKKIWRSRSGHTIVIDDSSGSEIVSLQTAAGHKIRFDDAGNVVLVEHKDGQKVTLTSGGIEIGTSAFKKLVNDTFQVLYNSHTHPTAATGPPSVPTQQMGSTHLTTDTKAS